ncbi:MAG TPA: alpha/beta hydrolase [Vicinamibacterales bacterium]|nr:alpha/beta hydrolase [Vicinamibacterales bacterium]
MHLLCSGQGAPSIILEVGLAAYSIDYTLVQRELEKSHRVCAYDRAGSGWSDRLPGETLSTNARDLHALLAAAKEPAPYVLVGAARGGLLIRGYLAAYPDEVSGLVFIDPDTEDRMFAGVDGKPVVVAEMTAEQFKATLPKVTVRIPRREVQQGPPFTALPPELYRQRLILDERFIAALPQTLTPQRLEALQEHERQSLAALLETRKAGTPFGNRPTIILSRGDQRDARAEAAHKALAGLSTNSRHMVIDGAGHEIHLLHPRAVVNAVNDVVEAVVKKTQLRPE